MKTQLIALFLFVSTAAAVAWYPQSSPPMEPPANPPRFTPPALPTSNAPPRIDAVFVLDTTGSMGGLIQAAKEKIWSIATTLASAQPTPRLRLGLVAYRDRGDDYVTRIVDLSEDLDSVYAALMEFRAQGGGDGPESVNQALHDAVHRLSWSNDQEAYRVVFLVGDAPPHMDYANEPRYPEVISAGLGKDIVVNAVQCGANATTTRVWQRIADLGGGSYFRVDQDGDAVAIATPYDEQLAGLSKQLDDTRLYYGSAEEQEARKRKLDAADKLHTEASVASRARRAVFNASAGGEANLLGKQELVEDVASGRVELDELEVEQLPAPLQALGQEERKARLAETAHQRQELQDRIEVLARQRADYLDQEVKRQGGAKESLDYQVFGAVREQAAKRGLRYESDAPEY